MKKIIIHIGYPKTGTSFLQEKVFVAMHDGGQINYLHFRQIADALQEITCASSLFFSAEDVRQMIAPLLKEGVNVISYESLIAAVFYKSANFTSNAENLFSLFPEATILMTLRNQADIICSLYAQYIHEGGTLQMAVFLGLTKEGLKEIDDNVLDIRVFDYDKALTFYKEIFGREQVRALFFEDFVLKKEKFVSDLCGIMGVEQLPTMDGFLDKTNESYAKNQISIARFMNRIFYSHFNRNALTINFKLPFSQKRVDIAVLRKLLQSPLSSKVFGSKKSDYSIHKEYLKEVFIASNQRLLSEHQLELPSKYL